ncbi:MAG: lysophospholipase [Actinomycetota bacterium]|nr:lysophospholipase [Actinomycetota bacterium]
MADVSIVEFESANEMLRGSLYLPRGSHEGLAGVVMAPGFGATIPMGGDGYAQALCDAGFAALLYDHAGFGMSGGESRQEVNPWRQVHGYRSAVSFLSARREIDESRIAVWGFSYSGGIALIAAATDERVAAAVALIPALGSVLPPPDDDGSLFGHVRDIVRGGPAAWPAGTTVGPLPIVTSDPLNTPAVVPVPSAFRWSIEYGGRFKSGWQNVATVVRPDALAPLHAGFCAPHLTVPSLWVIAPEDEVPGADPTVSRASYDAAGGDKELHPIDGGHFGLLTWPSEPAREATAVQVRFLQTALRRSVDGCG